MDDLRDHLDAAIGTGPGHRPVEPVLLAGHRAVRRRRIATITGTAAVVAVLGTTYALAGGQPDAARDPQVTHSGPTRSADPSPEPAAEPQPWGKGDYIRYDEDTGQLEVRPGVKVLDRVDDYLAGVTQYDGSVAMDVVFEGTEYWVTAEWTHDVGNGQSSSGASVAEANDGWVDFRAYVADQASANGAGVPGGSGYPGLVTVRPDGVFRPVNGTQVLDETRAGLPPGFDSAAYVEQDGARYLVLNRTIAGQPDLVTIHAERHGTSLDELLAYARQKYSDGEGVR